MVSWPGVKVLESGSDAAPELARLDDPDRELVLRRRRILSAGGGASYALYLNWLEPTEL